MKTLKNDEKTQKALHSALVVMEKALEKANKKIKQYGLHMTVTADFSAISSENNLKDTNTSAEAAKKE